MAEELHGQRLEQEGDAEWGGLVLGGLVLEGTPPRWASLDASVIISERAA